MRNTSLLAGAIALGATSAVAGGLDRSGQGIGVLFEDGGYVELSFGAVSPAVTGNIAGFLDAGDVAPTYTQLGFGIRHQVNDKVAIAVIMDQPFGADVDYATTGYPLTGTSASVSSTAITALGQYQISDRFSVHGGVRLQSLVGEVVLTAPAPYTMEATGNGVGYVLGAAYEIPDIALRVAITYSSEITQTMDAIEVAVVPSTFDIVTPRSLNLDFQSGIAADTLLFGSIRWVEWSTFDITPTLTPGPLVSYDNDTISYSLGVGRKFSDMFSGSISLGYEAAQGGLATNLAPTDGDTSLQIGGQYTQGNMTLSGGVRYVLIGDATTELVGADFADNSAIAVGLKVGYSF